MLASVRASMLVDQKDSAKLLDAVNEYELAPTEEVREQILESLGPEPFRFRESDEQEIDPPEREYPLLRSITQ